MIAKSSHDSRRIIVQIFSGNELFSLIRKDSLDLRYYDRSLLSSPIC